MAPERSPNMPLLPPLLLLAAQAAADPGVAAPEGATPAAPGGASLLQPVLLMAVIFGIFWFLIIRPQQKQEKARRAMLEALKKKDRVLTSGGILGSVADLRDDEVTVRISENPDVKIRVRRSAVVEILKDSADEPTR
jgi:preprotein translocase subunit YajC